jgi:hypothetical protein
MGVVNFALSRLVNFRLSLRPAVAARGEKGLFDFRELLEAHWKRIRQIQDGRLDLPNRVPYIEDHNTWVVNRPGTMLCIPVGDLAQHVLLNLCYFTQNGACIYDDVNNRKIPGIEQFSSLVNVDEPLTLSFMEQ